MSRFRIVSAFAAALTLAACSQSASDPLGPDGPRMNNGQLVVGSNRTDSDSTAAAPTTSTHGAVTSSLDEDTTPPEDGTPPKDNGGLVVGSN